jgi:hypothetical protein
MQKKECKNRYVRYYANVCQKKYVKKACNKACKDMFRWYEKKGTFANKDIIQKKVCKNRYRAYKRYVRYGKIWKSMYKNTNHCAQLWGLCVVYTDTH